jgi:hypothetical protein
MVNANAKICDIGYPTDQKRSFFIELNAELNSILSLDQFKCLAETERGVATTPS